MRGLTRAGINSNLNKHRDMALFYLKATGKFNAAIREWEAKPAANKTWVNIKSFISTEYAKEYKQNKLTAKQFKANAIEEQAEVTEELINALTENHTCQMESTNLQHGRSNERDDDISQNGQQKPHQGKQRNE
jgi:hypothetical protein